MHAAFDSYTDVLIIIKFLMDNSNSLRHLETLPRAYKPLNDRVFGLINHGKLNSCEDLFSLTKTRALYEIYCCACDPGSDQMGRPN